MTLAMANLTDDKSEELLAFVRTIANMQRYGDEMEIDCDDAVDCMNNLIDEARKIIGGTP
jgi:hypothetical protein